MARRRMFSLDVIDTDKFNDMSISARLLYYELCMRADDDGFVPSPKKIVRMVGCSEEDLKMLIAKGYAIAFDSGIIVITHWKMHNYIPKDRYHKTIFQEEQAKLTQKSDYTYALCDQSEQHCIQDVYRPDTECIQVSNNPYTEVRLGKVRLNNIVEQSPTTHISEIKEIISYLNQKAGTNYKPATKTTQKHINARLNEGYTVEDFKRVIDTKCTEWLNTDYSKYLRPETLFGNKFESYLNTAVTAKENSFAGYKVIENGYNYESEGQNGEF